MYSFYVPSLMSKPQNLSHHAYEELDLAESLSKPGCVHGTAEIGAI